MDSFGRYLRCSWRRDEPSTSRWSAHIECGPRTAQANSLQAFAESALALAGARDVPDPVLAVSVEAMLWERHLTRPAIGDEMALKPSTYQPSV